MGSFTSAIAPVLQAGSVLTTALQFASPLLKASGSAKAADAQYQKTAADIALKKQQNLLDYQTQEAARQRKLRAVLSTSRAESGAAGLDSSASSDAVRENMVSQSDIERQNNDANYSLNEAALDNSLSSARRQNLLSKQEARQNGLIDSFSSVF
ncbi:MAG: hypothetical protein WC043_10805 [Pseudobdellovibrionaceae bacterium]